MKRAPHRVRRLPNGLTDVEQHTINGFEISFNPDTDKFCVHAPPLAEYPDESGVIIAQFKEMRNAVQFARTHLWGDYTS